MSERISYRELKPGLLDGMNKTEVYLKKSGLDLKLMELVKYRISQINGCAFCLDMHHKESLHLGESELRLYSLAAWRDCPFYSEKEKAVFAFAEVLTYPDHHGEDDEVFEKLQQFYSKDEIAILTLCITQINAWNRINRAFRTTPGNYIVGQFN